MRNKNKFLLVLIVIIVNAAGFFLRYFQLDTYFIFLGFRFHLSLFLPFLFILSYLDFNAVKEMFIHPQKQRIIFILILIFLPLLFIALDYFFFKQFDIAGQDYFFEFGLSSIVDYPIYLIWNAPQLFMFFIFMNAVIHSDKYKFIKASALAFFLFMFELFPFEKGTIDFSIISYPAIISYFLMVLLTGLIISRINNVYLFALILFSILWESIITFGSSSETIINILFASQYDSWGGFIKPGKKFEYGNFLLPAYIFVIFIFSLLVLKKNRKTITPDNQLQLFNE